MVIGFLVKRGENCADHSLKAVCFFTHSYCSVVMLRVKASVKVRDNGTFIIRPFLKTLVIIGYPPAEASCNSMMSEHIGAEHLDHLPEDVPRFPIPVWSWKDLPLRERRRIGVVMLDIPHGDWLYSEGVVNQKFTVNSEYLIKPFFVPFCTLRDIPHCEEVIPFECPGFAGTDHPEVCERTMAPEKVLIAVLVQLGNPDAVFVGRRVLCDNVHGNFSEVEVGPDADGGCDAGGL